MRLEEQQTPEQAHAAAGEQDEAEDGLRFDDPWWDDAFCSWQDPALRTCC